MKIETGISGHSNPSAIDYCYILNRETGEIQTGTVKAITMSGGIRYYSVLISYEKGGASFSMFGDFDINDTLFWDKDLAVAEANKLKGNKEESED